MGGRGARSSINRGGINQGFKVTIGGETTSYFFSSKNGVNYFQREIGAVPEETPLNMSAKEFRNRVVANGGKVVTISKNEIAKKEKKYKEEQKNKPDYETGNAFQQHGWGATIRKNIYRPRRSR